MAKNQKLELISVSIAEALETLRANVKGGLNVYLEGPAGLGKTELVNQLAEELGAKVYTIRLAQCEPSDLFGFPIPREVDGKTIVKFSRPEILPPEDDSDTLYIIFFDELNRANTQNINAVMQATDSSKRIGMHNLPKNCVVVAAGNPASEDAYDVKMLDMAVATRFHTRLRLRYDAKSLHDYAVRKGWHSNVTSFIKMMGDQLFNSMDYDGNPVCVPRTLEGLSQNEKLTGLSQNKTRHYIESLGAIGPAHGAAYHEFCFNLKPVTFAELKTKKGMERIQKMADLEGGNYRADLISMTNENICEHFADKTIIDDKDVKLICQYGCAIAADQAAALLTLLQTLPIRDAFRAAFAKHGNELVAHCGSRLGL